jgi:hypothetical protein
VPVAATGDERGPPVDDVLDEARIARRHRQVLERIRRRQSALGVCSTSRRNLAGTSTRGVRLTR